MNNESRRKLLVTSRKLLIGTAAFDSLVAYAVKEHHMPGSGEELKVDAEQQDSRATCQFRSSMRKGLQWQETDNHTEYGVLNTACQL